MRVSANYLGNRGVKVIRSRNVNQFDALEFDVFVDGSLLVSQVFPAGQEVEYLAALASRIAQFVEGGWLESSPDNPPSR